VLIKDKTQPGSPNLYIAAVLLFGFFSVFFLVSCISIDSEQEGVIGNVYEVDGVKILLDPASDKLLAFALRNDSQRQVSVQVRPIGGMIGYRTSGSSGFGGVGMGSSSKVQAGYLVSPNDIVLNTGDDAMGKIFLNNWHTANQPFNHRFEFNVRVDGERHRIMIRADQDDIFDDAKDTFQQNKLGRNNPGNYGAKHIGASNLPPGFTLTIPD